MEASVQEKRNAYRFTINDPFREECPACGQSMTNMIDDMSICENPSCPFLGEGVQTVVYALIEAGRTIIEACDIAATYSLESDLDPEVAERKFTVDSMESANWVLKKIAQAPDSLSQIQAMADAEYNAIQQRADDLKQAHINTIAFFQTAYGPQLEAWAAAELVGEKKKSKPLIYGKVGFKKSRDKVVVIDEDAAIEWCACNNPEAVKTSILTSNLSDEALKKDFVHIEPGVDKFYIDAKLPEVQ
jgi:hypothetical protein